VWLGSKVEEFDRVTCDLDGEDKKCIPNPCPKPSEKATTWKIEEEEYWENSRAVLRYVLRK
jgi:hypothetical protein